ncbi:MAG: tetratricopeptide repeat protein [Phycisphaerae bacterium]
MSQWKQLQERISGKWQIPLFVVSLGLLAGAFLRVRPKPSDVPLDESLKYMDALQASGGYARVLDIGEQVLSVGEPPTDAEFAAIHLRFARARHDLAVKERHRNADAGQQVLDDFRNAEAHGLPLTAQDRVRFGDAFEWIRKPAEALDQFEQALAMGIGEAAELRKHVFDLRDQLGRGPEKQLAFLDEFLAGLEDHRLDLRLWAVGQKLQLLDESQRLIEASTLLVREAPYFAESDLRDGFNYLEALLLYKQGLFDEAEATLRAIRNRVEPHDIVYAETGWLLGRVVLKDDGPKRPYEAASFFRDVIERHGDSAYGVASMVGLGEAMSMIGRHDEAIRAFESAASQLPLAGDRYLVNEDVVRVTLGLLAEEQKNSGHLKAALSYAQLATKLVDRANDEQLLAYLEQLGQIQELLAMALKEQSEAEPSPDERQLLLREAKSMFVAASDSALQIGRLPTLKDRRSAAALWRAAELLRDGGALKRAADLYAMFTADHPDHPLVPRAMLRTGQVLQATGDLEGAIAGFRECYALHHRTIDGMRALIPLARCYMALGTEKEALVEQTLDVILEDSEFFTPGAPEFADALFLYGEVLNRRGAYEEAITRLEEVVERYPDDERIWSARALLADSYRQSALALKKEVSETGSAAEIEHIHSEAVARFDRARALYRALIDEFALRDKASLTELERVNLRHAYVNEADCFFETAKYQEALKLYEDVASVFKRTTTALAAYVQIINCYVFLGQPDEARAALARARILVDAIDDEAFERSVSPENRSDWKRYFAWLEGAELF